MRFDMTKRGTDRIARAATAFAATVVIGFGLFGADAANAQAANGPRGAPSCSASSVTPIT